jgi:hypothetical protein
MATKVIVTGGSSSSSPETYTVATHNTNVFGESFGYQKVVIQSGVTGVALDANIEGISLSGSLSDYKFLAVSGTGFRIYKISDQSTVATLATINQAVKIDFNGSSATLQQTGSASFTLNGVSVATNSVATFDNAATPSSDLLSRTTLSLTADEATSNLTYGVRFAPTQDITITGTGTDLATLAPNAHNLGGKSITLDASGNNQVSLTLAQASDTVVFGGVHFAADDVVSVVGTATADDVPITLAAALVDLGVTGTQITLDQNINMNPGNNGAVTGSLDALGEWSFDGSTDILTYWNGSAKTITLAGINTVTVAASGDMTMTLG